MIAIAFVAIAVALVLIVYAIEVHLPERQGAIRPSSDVGSAMMTMRFLKD
jgi:hypothetical protein